MKKQSQDQQLESQDSKQNQNECSSIDTLAQEFLIKSEVLKLKEQLEQKDKEIAHLKQLLMSYSPLVGQADVAPVTDEEIIALKQLERLKKTALERELTLDEVKRMDLLVKNKRLAQGNATNINDNKKDLPKDVTPAQLIQIASRKIVEE